MYRNDPQKQLPDEHFNSPETQHTTDPGSFFDASVLRALAQAPEIAVPTDFARRVAQKAVALPRPRARAFAGWGPRLMFASAAVLTAGMFALAPHAAPTVHSLSFDTELILLAELSCLILFAQRLLPNS